MAKKSLQLEQINRKMQEFMSLRHVTIPPTGWIKAIRTSLGISMQQLGNKLSITKQGILDYEKREKEGSITLKSLKEIGRAMDMQLEYGFVPNDGTVDALIEKRTRELATKIVLRTANTMKLEDQDNSPQHLESAIKERTEALKREMPKALWD